MQAISDLIVKLKRPSRSIELTQPKAMETQKQLLESLADIKDSLDFVSLSNHKSQGLTLVERISFAQQIQSRYDIPVLEHVTVAGIPKEKLFAYLAAYQTAGIQNILVVKGDDPLTDRTMKESAQLLAAIAANGGFNLAATLDIKHLIQQPAETLTNSLAKQAAGASFLITQPIQSLAQWQSGQRILRKQALQLPLVAGIMPPGASKGLKKDPTRGKLSKQSIQECQLLVQDLAREGLLGWHIFSPQLLSGETKSLIASICQEN